MLKPKAANRQHWETVSDEELLGKSLTTDNPLDLEGLVTKIPDGPEEPHVEFSYDLDDEVRCVHGNHRHKHGFVFRKGKHRYLVGWICGDKIYGEKFDQYAADFKAAQTRQDAMRRVQNIRTAVANFVTWSTSPQWRNAIDAFENLRGSIFSLMPSVFTCVQDHAGKKLRDAPMPRYLCFPFLETPGDPREMDIRREYRRFSEELNTIAIDLSKPPAAVAAVIGGIVERLRGIVRRANIFLAKFDDIELFFQPITLQAICDHIDTLSPRRTKHRPSLLKITARNFSIEMPKDFSKPDRRGLEALEQALNASN